MKKEIKAKGGKPRKKLRKPIKMQRKQKIHIKQGIQPVKKTKEKNEEKT